MQYTDDLRVHGLSVGSSDVQEKKAPHGCKRSPIIDRIKKDLSLIHTQIVLQIVVSCLSSSYSLRWKVDFTGITIVSVGEFLDILVSIRKEWTIVSMPVEGEGMEGIVV